MSADLSRCETSPPTAPPGETLRWTVDCWTAGCGWSQVGFVVGNLAVTAAQHREEHHRYDDE